MRHSILLLFLLVGCAASPPSAGDPLDVTVDSWRDVDVVPLNSRVEEAVDAGFDWPQSALYVTLTLLGGDADTRSLVLSEVANRGEAADTMVVVVARDGLLDDSIRGDWHRTVLYRVTDGTWRLHEMHRAFRCYRGGSLDAYSADLCP